MSVEDTLAFEMLASSIKNVGACFELGLPWKQARKELPDNRVSVIAKIAECYVTSIEKYVFDGHARLLATSELGGPNGRGGIYHTTASSTRISRTRLG